MWVGHGHRRARRDGDIGRQSASCELVNIDERRGQCVAIPVDRPRFVLPLIGDVESSTSFFR